MLIGDKPVLLLDVDGVLIPYAAKKQPPGFLPYVLLGESVWLARRHGDWLRPLCERFQVVWATGWEHDANRLIGPILELPAFPVIEFARDAARRFAKLPTIMRVVAEQPLVWVDDELSTEAYQWAAEREARTLLLDANSEIGLTQEIVAAIIRFRDLLD